MLEKICDIDVKLLVPIVLAIASAGFGGGSCIAAARDWGYNEPTPIVVELTEIVTATPTATYTATATATQIGDVASSFKTTPIPIPVRSVPAAPIPTPRQPITFAPYSPFPPQPTPAPVTPPIIIVIFPDNLKGLPAVATPTSVVMECWPKGLRRGNTCGPNH
jgi:hypothetical protein